ncbi:MAG: NrfD/PsrC family molybdoenzyme membrane anchor subunit [Candidatus Electronema sp. V4]|uniref:NrfD/PsrC family molybdoenzyme membrane anchor subunit n=1 Tax=Candidatus Electronema sp. V4 TaxID=3454756 RepID=UPI00405584DE
MTTYQTSAAKPSFFSPGAALLLLLVVIGAGAAVYRLTAGLGATTHLYDQFPWGHWKQVNVLFGVALSGCGFTMAAVVYIFNLKQYKSLARPAVLAALAGYLSVSLTLIFDLGKPMSFWHPIIMWQPRSMLFEIIWCMMLYTGVLVLELSPAFLEGIGMNKLAKLMHALMLPFVIAAVTLSFLHQSSLGGIFLLMPGTLSHLWWTTMLPYNFFLSAIVSALAVTTIIAYYAASLNKQEADPKVVQGLARGTAYALLVYAVVRLGDMLLKGNLGLAFTGSFAATFFLLEVAGGVLLPMLLLFLVGKSKAGILLGQSLVIAGILLNRLNVAFFTQAQDGAMYMPSLTEFLLSFGVVAGAILLFKAGAIYLPIVRQTEAAA